MTHKKAKKYTFNFSIFKDFRKSKKGAFLDGVGGAINGLVDLMPPQLKFLVFLLLIVAFSYILSIVFNSFGIFCNSANLPVKLNTNIITSISLIASVPDFQDINKEIIPNPENQQFGVEECIVQITNGTITYDDGTTEAVVNRKVYKDAGCIVCFKSGHITESRAGLDVSGRYCLDSLISPKPLEDKTFMERQFCGNKFFGRCQPPEHYYYKFSTNQYLCADSTCSGVTVGVRWDETLRDKGAQLMYPTQNGRDRTSTGLIGITCSDLSPRLAFYGIDLFSFTLWIFIMLIVILFWAWTHFT